MTTAQEAIAALRGGAPFAGDSAPFLKDGRLDPAALSLLATALRSTEDDVRREVADALVLTVERSDPLWREGGIVIRDPAVVAVLVADGGCKLDPAKETCYGALLNAVPPTLLAPHGPALLDDLVKNPDATTLLIVARLKLAAAAPALEALLWGKDPWFRFRQGQIAAAAYGDRLTELATVIPFEAATDPAVKSGLALDLGRIGTPLALRTLGRALRTPLFHDRGYIKRSCRVDVVAGLRMTYVDEPALFENRFTSDAQFEIAEAFVARELGVSWPEPRPPFLWKEVGYHGPTR